MSVEIEPTELSFKRPFTVEVARILRIKNPNQSPIAFKVGSHSIPRLSRYPPLTDHATRSKPPLRSNIAFAPIRVVLNLDKMWRSPAMKQEPALDAKCRDKFLVQSVSITADKEFASIANILDQTDKSSLIERKIRVTWLAEESSLNGGSASAVASTPNRQSLVNGDYTPDVSNVYSSPQQGTESGSPAPATRPSTSDVKDDTVSEKAQSTVSAASHVIANTAQITYEELKQKLSQAEAKIASLQDTSGLRQRVKTETEKLPTAQEAAAAVRQGAEGVSVQMVAILCLLSFLLAYFFF
ncbi:MSP domain-containing protein [Colletotrichum orchidophilum]|uniref:MSP domain-containing protein n=1 Tax=Colletotrichum orchidophilum TaxID=1209926 RepID=A0A1G4AP33_9PEZI|nr:MSP domain-containing protein [Colletotrichum orchidophilum]OHE90866.1 MSP domain-containing protein [Colletotrichum orchidophilum]